MTEPTLDNRAARKAAGTKKQPLTKTQRQQRSQGTWKEAFSRQNLASTILTGYLPILIALLVIVLPLAWMILSSFKPPSEVVTLNPSLLPQAPTTENYQDVARRVPLLTVLGNSIYV